jgi:T5SS/PEP-CTERM-associated repeat protein
MRAYILRFGAVASSALALLAFSPSAQAVVQVTGNVWLSPDASGTGYTVYADDPFTTTVNEGIPTNGNRIDPFRAGDAQIEFEGQPVLNGPGTADDDNVNFDIVVGRTSSGEMIINQSQLRDQNLIIGDEGTVGSTIKRGSGVVRIEGFGSLYNNDPTILPYLGPNVPPDTSPSTTPRLDDVGFDLYVGRFGSGVLQLALGGRSEIQDAAIVGSQSGSVGTLLIDGIDSFLQSGGFETDSSDPNEVHYMIVGQFGSGTMTIANGGQSYNSGPTSSTGGSSDTVFGAVIGSNLAAVDANAPGAGGQGTVYVDGVASKWTVAGNLQVGGFHDKRDGIGPTAMEDLDGNELQYFTNTGRGSLHVSNGALVSIVTLPLDENAANAPNRLDFLVGRFGRVELDGGRIELLGAYNSTNPQSPSQQVERGRLINDGVVTGSGSISVMQFRNRVLGEVRVGAGQTLLVDASGDYTETDNLPLPGEPEYPLSNYGLIEVLGTDTARAEIEFQRAPGVVGAPAEPIRPFLNLPLLGPPSPGNGRTGGEIIGQDAIMRFDSGIINSHKVSFTGGTNLVSGNFDNEGTVFVGGDNTTVTFIDEFFGSGVLQLEPNISLVMFIDNVTFGGAASLNTTFGGRPTGQEISHISSAEDIVLGGTLNASLFTSPGFPSFSPQPGDQFEIISSAADLIGNFSSVNLPGCIGGSLCFVGFPDYTLDKYFVQAFAVPVGGGPDLNGDGVVDDVDYNIWRQNFGTTGPAGDANNDGTVDASDYTIWRDACCGPFPGAGSGSGSGGGFGGTVPEPTSIALLACGGMLALARRRRHLS